MNNSINDFILFCDEYQIAEEKLETNILDKTLSPTITLYHGTSKDLKTIKPTSMNMGTRLSPKSRLSSFWTKSLDYAIVWALDWIAIRGGFPYFHDIERNYFVIPEAQVRTKDGKIMWLEEWMYESIDKTPVYVYRAEVPTKYVGRGQLPIDEYTVDIEVIPNKKIIVTSEMAKPYIKYANHDAFAREISNGRGVYSKENVKFMEKLIFKNKYKVIEDRKKYYKKIERMT